MIEKVVFIDRDGVINKDPGGRTKYGYVTKWADFQFLPGVFEAFVLLKQQGYRSVIISNQQSVGKGYCSETDINDIDLKMKNEVLTAGGQISASYYCMHLKEDNCSCRKPKEGLFLKAKDDLNISSLDNMFFIGDSETDIIAGKRAGLKTTLVLSGKSQKQDTDVWELKPDYICEGLLDAVKVVIRK